MNREPDGWITIGIGANDKKLRRQMKDLEAQYNNKKIELDFTESELSKEQAILQELNEQVEGLDAKWINIGKEIKSQEKRLSEITTKTKDGFEIQPGKYTEYNKIISTIDQLKAKSKGVVEEIDNVNNKIDKQEQKVGKINVRYEKQKSQLEGIKRRYEEINKGDLGNISKSIDKVVKKVGKWALAVFGVRSAYMFIRQAMSTLSQYNEQLASDIQYIKYAIATTLEPIIERIIQLAYKLLAYIALIAKAWFNIDLFANASVDKFKAVNDNLKGANKSAKELQKTLAGFDEMNILQENGTTAIGGGGGGIATPSFDLSQFQVEIPAWLQWILDNKDTILAIITGLATALIGLKLTGFDPIVGVLSFILGLGIYEFIKGIIDMINNPSWKAFGEILQGLGIIISSISVILMALGVVSGPIGWIMLAVGALTGLIGSLIIELDKNRDGIKSVEQATKDLTEAKNNVMNATKQYTQAVKDSTKAHEELARAERETGLSGKELYNIVETTDLTYQDLTETQKRVYDAYVNEQAAIGGVDSALQKLNETKKEEIKQSIEQELSNGKEGKSFDTLKEKIINAYSKGQISAEEASDYISRAMSTMSYDSMKAFATDIPDSIKKGLDPYKYMTKMEKLKAWWNGEINKFKNEIQLKVTASNSGLQFKGYVSPGQNYFAKGGIVYDKLPRLASGGLINMPGKGVPIGSAIGGERGREGVIPLTDSQQMELLGASIGKYITINVNNVTELDGRQIARQVKQVNAESDFAFNR